MIHRSLLLLILVTLASQCALAEGTRITPKWIKDNPGRLSLTSGSGFAGHTDYIAHLETEREAIYEVWTKIQFITDDKRTAPGLRPKPVQVRLPSRSDSVTLHMGYILRLLQAEVSKHT